MNLPRVRFFGGGRDEDIPDDRELLAMQEEASFQIALLHLVHDEMEDALQMLEGVGYPEASFQQAMVGVYCKPTVFL